MKNLILVSLLIGVILFLSACEKPKTVSYYVEHQDEMEAKIEECNDDQTKFVKDGNCINARAARNELFFKPVKVNKHNQGPGLFPLKEKN